MTRQRHVYETAFDCRVAKSDDDLDQIDQVSNHPVLIQLNRSTSRLHPGISGDIASSSDVDIKQAKDEDNKEVDALSKNLEAMRMNKSFDDITIDNSTRPSTERLSNKSRSNIGSTSSVRSERRGSFEDPRLSVQESSGRGADNEKGGEERCEVEVNEISGENKGGSNNDGVPKQRPNSENVLTNKKRDRIREIKDRPRRNLFLYKFKDKSKLNVLDLKNSRRRCKYSSSESVNTNTSSSGGSMESLRSSTSEENRSTTSSESRPSTSLSSHSSDSGKIGMGMGMGIGLGYLNAKTCNYLNHANKLHILSPISDKSSQEPVSETSDNNRNNNSQKCSPEEVVTPENVKSRKRLLQNKNILTVNNRAENEMQGSDSGISVRSREGKSAFGFTNKIAARQDYSDLPFDMPKLRRRKLVQQDACTSSNTSVDLYDLPFDMPKLKRRLRIPQSSTESSVSQASSSQSVMEIGKPDSDSKSKLTLELEMDFKLRKRPSLNLTAAGLGLRFDRSHDDKRQFDIELPLEKQTWYHGAITKLDAETILKYLGEGSFLVRNSEFVRQDYSLSLKGTKGFMHMKIGRNVADGSYTLGQCSRSFETVPEMIRYFSNNRLPFKGAEHMCLIRPVDAQLL